MDRSCCDSDREQVGVSSAALCKTHKAGRVPITRDANPLEFRSSFPNRRLTPLRLLTTLYNTSLTPALLHMQVIGGREGSFQGPEGETRRRRHPLEHSRDGLRDGRKLRRPFRDWSSATHCEVRCSCAPPIHALSGHRSVGSHRELTLSSELRLEQAIRGNATQYYIALASVRTLSRRRWRWRSVIRPEEA